MSERLFENKAEIDLRHSAWTTDVATFERLAPTTLATVRSVFDGTAHPGRFMIQSQGSKQEGIITNVQIILAYDEMGTILVDATVLGTIHDAYDDLEVERASRHRTFEVASDATLEDFLADIDDLEAEVLVELGRPVEDVMVAPPNDISPF